MLLEIAIILVLTVVNGVLAMSELAVVSSRPARLKVLADQGSRGAEVAIRLAEHPGRFLSTVQIGITLVGVLSGAFSGATLGVRLSTWMQDVGLSQNVAEWLGVGVVVVLITYLSLIVGELVPKQIALRDPERVAAKVAPAMNLLSRLGAPLVWLLDNSGRLILMLLGQRGSGGDGVTEEEVKTIIAEAETAGVIERDEGEMIAGVMRLADRTANALMTPRREVEVVNLAEPLETIRQRVRASRRSRLPVQDGDADSIIGVVLAKDVLEAFAARARPDLASLVQEAPIVLDRTHALDVLRAIRGSHVHMTLVFDEYGHFEGIVTANDVLEAIIGALPEAADEELPIVTRDDGSLLISGWMAADEFAAQLGIPLDRDADFQTVAGFVLAEMQRLPQVGESFEKAGWRFEVLDLDGRRIDKILASRLS
ncbi:MAG: HlyC/CorC family transporter [Phreatobacter sp.]|uniref:hemolysin family protein n=1 Tax=Phreatobacter sp. TaxID=1966341 RepID=UPI001A4E66D1|nr:hemolysin family protein [Phreatobacter sp.]MBL8570762.1 HlyC/CorC family transporter [Phreatobacter sp.]